MEKTNTAPDTDYKDVRIKVISGCGVSNEEKKWQSVLNLLTHLRNIYQENPSYRPILKKFFTDLTAAVIARYQETIKTVR